MAVQVYQPRRQDNTGSTLGLIQAAAPLLAFTPAGPLGAAAVGAGVGLLSASRQQQSAPQLPQTSDRAIRDRLGTNRRDSLALLREANDAIDLLPEDQRAKYQRPIGMALAQV